MSNDGPDVVTAPAGSKPNAPETLAAENLLYPELAAHGQLARAIQAAAAELGVDLGTVAPSQRDPRRWARVDSRVSDREPLGIGIGAVERWFLVSGWSRGVQLVSGATQYVEEVVRAAVAWRRGASLSEIQEIASFVEVSDIARAHERGPADAVTEKWGLLRAAWSSDDRFHFVADIIEAAYAAPVLRQLFPYTSHASLCFSTCTGFPFSDDVPRIDPREGGGYVLRNRFMGDVIGEADDAESTITILLANLPDNVGPVVAGAAAGLQ
jgi:hypothetical protein